MNQKVRWFDCDLIVWWVFTEVHSAMIAWRAGQAPMETKGSDFAPSQIRSLDRFQWKYRGVPSPGVVLLFTGLHRMPPPHRFH